MTSPPASEASTTPVANRIDGSYWMAPTERVQSDCPGLDKPQTLSKKARLQSAKAHSGGADHRAGRYFRGTLSPIEPATVITSYLPAAPISWCAAHGSSLYSLISQRTMSVVASCRARSSELANSGCEPMLIR